jgi:hypothetical protein
MEGLFYCTVQESISRDAKLDLYNIIFRKLFKIKVPSKS